MLIIIMVTVQRKEEEEEVVREEKGARLPYLVQLQWAHFIPFCLLVPKKKFIWYENDG